MGTPRSVWGLLWHVRGVLGAMQGFQVVRGQKGITGIRGIGAPRGVGAVLWGCQGHQECRGCQGCIEADRDSQYSGARRGMGHQ